MTNKVDVKSVLKLNRLVFDKIEFVRRGNKNNEELELNLEANVSKNTEEELYRVSLILKGTKPNEYTMEICLTGYFSFSTDKELTAELKQSLINRNTLSILMPYLRSQVSLLTAQPNVDCVVLPPFNINGMVDNADGE
jgi:preprotein translocase subunit SecB